MPRPSDWTSHLGRCNVHSRGSLHSNSPVCTAVCGILNLPENDDVAVLGTVYKDMKLKPSILDEYVKVTAEMRHMP